jgi:hypothetical protein
MRKGQTADQIRIYAAMRDGRSPHRAAALVVPCPSLPKSTQAPTEYEAIERGRERLDAIEEAKLRRAQALAERQELENQKLRLELIPTVYVRQWTANLLTAARDGLTEGVGELENVLAAQSDPVTCAAIVRAWIERMIATLYRADCIWTAPNKGEEGRAKA